VGRRERDCGGGGRLVGWFSRKRRFTLSRHTREPTGRRTTRIQEAGGGGGRVGDVLARYGREGGGEWGGAYAEVVGAEAIGHRPEN